MSDKQGGCLCGKLRFTLKEDPQMMAVCHCTDCQKQTSSAFSVVAIAAEQAVTVVGSSKVYEKLGDSGQPVQRHFCPDCGTTVFTKADVMPGATILKGGAFDDTSWLKPTLHIFCDSAQNWVKIPDDSTKFPRMPS